MDRLNDRLNTGSMDETIQGADEIFDAINRAQETSGSLRRNKKMKNVFLCAIGLLAAVFFSSCANKNAVNLNNFSLKNTLSIFLLNDGKEDFFCIPVQYIGEYQIENFEFDSGYIQIGDYEILLKKDELNISLDFSSDSENMNHFNIFIEKYLSKDDIEKIISEYEKGNVYSKFFIWYDLTLDNEEQPGNGLYDDFELYNGPVDTAWFPENLDFFKAKYLQK